MYLHIWPQKKVTSEKGTCSWTLGLVSALIYSLLCEAYPPPRGWSVLPHHPPLPGRGSRTGTCPCPCRVCFGRCGIAPCGPGAQVAAHKPPCLPHGEGPECGVGGRSCSKDCGCWCRRCPAGPWMPLGHGLPLWPLWPLSSLGLHPRSSANEKLIGGLARPRRPIGYSCSGITSEDPQLLVCQAPSANTPSLAAHALMGQACNLIDSTHSLDDLCEVITLGHMSPESLAKHGEAGALWTVASLPRIPREVLKCGSMVRALACQVQSHINYQTTLPKNAS